MPHRLVFYLPNDVPLPRFCLWQSVEIDDGDRGIVIGLEFIKPSIGLPLLGWVYRIELDDSTPHKRIEPIRSAIENQLRSASDGTPQKMHMPTKGRDPRN